jgi:hypothetical protein
MRKDRGIVTAPRPNLHHGFSFRNVAGSQPGRMCARHPHIDFAFPIQRDGQVLVEKRRIIVGRLHVTVRAEVQPPRTLSGEGLAFHRSKRLLYMRIIEIGYGANHFGIKRAIFF